MMHTMKWFCFTRCVLLLCIVLPLSAQQRLPNSLPDKKAFTRKYIPVSKEPMNAVKIEFNGKIVQSAQWIRIKNWNEETSVVAESDSVVWVGTTVGLIRWNTVNSTYTTYDETNGLTFTGINSLAIDQAKHLWITTTQGIVKYSNGIFTYFDSQNSNLPDAQFTHIVFDSLNRVYVGYESYHFGQHNV